MQQSPFVCRSCLQRLRQSWQPAFCARSMRHLTQPSSSKHSPPIHEAPLSSHVTGRLEQERQRLHALNPDESLEKWYSKRLTVQNANKKGDSEGQEASDLELDSSSYPVEDQEFWYKFNDMWNKPDTEGKVDSATAKSEDGLAVLATELGDLNEWEEVLADGELTTSTLPKQRRNGPKTRSRGSVIKGRGRQAQTLSKKQQRPKDFVTTVQLRHLRFTSDPEQFPELSKRFRKWKKTMAMAFREQKQSSPGTHPSPNPTLRIQKLKWLLEQGSVEEMRTAWMSLPSDRRDRIWPNVIKSCVRSSPDKLIAVLQATCQDQAPPKYAIQDAFEFLVRRSLILPPAEKSECFGSMYDLVTLLLVNFPEEKYQFRQSIIFRIMTNIEESKRDQFYSVLTHHGHPLHFNTLLQFASYFARNPAQKKTAIDILNEVVQKERTFDINGPVGASLCTSILHMGSGAIEQKSITLPPAQLFEHLLELGFQPNVIVYTTLIRNLCLTKEMEAAWQVFDVMMHHNIRPDAHVYSVLLNGAKESEDFASIRRVLNHVYAGDIRSNPIGNEVLHAILTTALMDARKSRLKPPRVVPVFPFMLQAYAKMFQLDELELLLIGDLKYFEKEYHHWRVSRGPWRFPSRIDPVVDGLPAWKSDELLQPDGLTLAFMIMGHVHSFSNQYSVIAFYNNFRKLLKQGHPAAELIVREQGSIVHDIIIKKLLEWPGMLRSALDVVGDMLKDSIASGSPSSTTTAQAVGAAGSVSPDVGPGEESHADALLERPASLRHPAPSVYTWSILLDGFMQYRRDGQAERILQMMRQHGVQPCRVTWNTLVAGYAREQKVSKMVRALQRLEADGLEADEWTMRAFSYLRNKHRAIAEMEAMIERRERQNKEQKGDGSEGARLVTHKSLPNPQPLREQVGETEADLRRLESEVEDIARVMDQHH